MERQILTNFIEAYKNNVCLWDVRCADYSNKHKRQAAYEELLNIYKVLNEKANVDTTKKKIEILRNSYRREKKKVENSKGTDPSRDGTYTPFLWYYPLLDSFLGKNEPDEIEFEEDTESYNRSADAAVVTAPVEEPRELPPGAAPKKRKYESSTRNEPSFPAKKAPSNHNGHEHVPCASCAVSNYLQRRDEAEVVAKSWALDLQKMDKVQQIFAKKAINEILLEGQLGNLHHQFVRFEPKEAGATAWVTDEVEDHDIESDSDYIQEKKYNPFEEGTSC